MLYRLADIFLSLLPARYRSHYQMDPVTGTLESGLLQLLLAFVVYLVLFFRYLQQFGALSGSLMVQAAGQELHSTAFGVGVIGWLAFSITPGPLAAMYFMIEGGVRALAALITHAPLASLPFWLLAQVHGLFERSRKRRREAPPALDVVETGQPGDAWDLRITAVRKKSDWQGLVQVEYGGVYYVVSSSVEEESGGRLLYRYYLRRATGTEGFRGIIRYDPFRSWESAEK